MSKHLQINIKNGESFLFNVPLQKEDIFDLNRHYLLIIEANLYIYSRSLDLNSNSTENVKRISLEL